MKKKVLLVVHLYYADKLLRLLHCVENVVETCESDIYVSGIPQLVAVVRERFPSCNIVETGNIGYDIWPFISVLNQVNLAQYDYIVKLHTKRDMPAFHRLPHADTEGSAWCDFLLSFVENKKDWAQSLATLETELVGMVADYHICIGSSEDPREKLKRLIQAAFSKVSASKIEHFFFPAGAMFVVKARCFVPLQRKFSIQDFSQDIGSHEDGFSHAVERVLGYLVYATGKEIYTNHGKRISEIYKEHLINKIIKKKNTRRHVIYKVFGIPIFLISRKPQTDVMGKI